MKRIYNSPVTIVNTLQSVALMNVGSPVVGVQGNTSELVNPYGD